MFDSISPEMLEIFLRRVADSDPRVYCDAFDTLLRKKLKYSTYYDASDVLSGLMIRCHSEDKLAFFRLHKLAIGNKVWFPFMAKVFEYSRFWPAEVLAYGIAVNSSEHAADWYFLEFLSRDLRYHDDPGVRVGAEFFLRIAALSHTKGQSSVWRHELLDEIPGKF